MLYQDLGTSGIKISRLCLGCMSFGNPSADFHQWTLDQRGTDDMVARALELGINFFDTANVYSHGSSEEFLGRALKKAVRREDVVIATKVYFNEGRLSRAAISREIDGSLKRLGTDYVDLYIIHRFDYGTPVEETMSALHDLVKAGKVRALGASAMYGYQFHNMQRCAIDNQLTPFASMQNHYNLMYREDERELIPVCRQFGTVLTPYSPLAAGHLCRPQWSSDSLRSATDTTAKAKYDHAREMDLPLVARTAEVAARLGTSMAAEALAWLLYKGAAAPIIGTTKLKYLDEAAGAMDVKLSAEDVSFLEELYQPHPVVGALPLQQ